MDIAKILKAKYVGDLFPNNERLMKDKYRELIKKWHPDLHGNSKESTAAMAIITSLYKQGLKLIKEGTWEKTNYVMLKSLDNKIFEINYRSYYRIELGECYICDTSVIYVIGNKYRHLCENFNKIVSNIKYPNKELEKKLNVFIPTVELQFETANEIVMKIKKPHDVFSLTDVFYFYNKEIPERHVAWIINRIYELSCLLQYNKISHNGLIKENLFINPDFHGIFLYGGWWFSCEINKPIRTLPKKVFNLIPYDVKMSGEAESIIDLESIKLLGRELLGDEYGSKLIKSKSIPQPMTDWLLKKSGITAFGEFTNWNNVLDKSFGKREFYKMDINRRNLYKGE